MIRRASRVREVVGLLRDTPTVGLLGARQVGKTTLAAMVAAAWDGPVHRFDLEQERDLARLEHPQAALEPLRGLVIIDEIHRRPEIFPTLRVLADRPRSGRRFLILGSASPGLLRQSSETLAGRIAWHTLSGFSLDEVGIAQFDRLWRRGGFPRSFLARTEGLSVRWRADFARTFLERDLPGLGITVPSATMGRFWRMLAHYHGQTWNASEFARSFGVSDFAVRRYLDLLTSAFMVRQLAPWRENLGKRQVKAPKIYLTDCGLFHTLIGAASSREDLEAHPKVGASWEGFCLEAVLRTIGADPEESYFWATHGGAELDLLVVRGRRRRGFEFKRTDAPRVTPSMQIALHDLRLDRLEVIHAGRDSYPLTDRIHAVAARHLLRSPAPLRP